MASEKDRLVRRVSAPATVLNPSARSLLPADLRAAQPAPRLDPLDALFGMVPSPPHDHHVRLTERHCAKLLRSIGWVMVSGTPSQAPHLIRPRRLDHLGGC